MQAGMDSWGRMRGPPGAASAAEMKSIRCCVCQSVLLPIQRGTDQPQLSPVTHSYNTLQSRSFTGLVLKQIALNHFSSPLFFVF